MAMIDLEVEVHSGWGVGLDRGGMDPASKAKAPSVMSSAFPKLALEKNKLNRHSFRALVGARCFKVLQGAFPAMPFLSQSCEIGEVFSIFS